MRFGSEKRRGGLVLLLLGLTAVICLPDWAEAGSVEYGAYSVSGVAVSTVTRDGVTEQAVDQMEGVRAFDLDPAEPLPAASERASAFVQSFDETRPSNVLTGASNLAYFINEDGDIRFEQNFASTVVNNPESSMRLLTVGFVNFRVNEPGELRVEGEFSSIGPAAEVADAQMTFLLGLPSDLGPPGSGIRNPEPTVLKIRPGEPATFSQTFALRPSQTLYNSLVETSWEQDQELSGAASGVVTYRFSPAGDLSSGGDGRGTPIPTPSAALAGLVGLLGVAMRRRERVRP